MSFCSRLAPCRIKEQFVSALTEIFPVKKLETILGKIQSYPGQIQLELWNFFMSLLITNLWILFSYSFRVSRWVIHLATLSVSFYGFFLTSLSFQFDPHWFILQVNGLFGSLDPLMHLGELNRVSYPWWCLIPIVIEHHWRMAQLIKRRRWTFSLGKTLG